MNSPYYKVLFTASASYYYHPEAVSASHLPLVIVWAGPSGHNVSYGASGTSLILTGPASANLPDNLVAL